MPNKLSLNYYKLESAKKKKIKKPSKRNLACNLKHIKIFLNSNHFNTIIYIKHCCVPSYTPNKPSLNYFMRESAKKALKNF